YRQEFRGAPNASHKFRFTSAWNKWEKAAESYDKAEEVGDFQPVGVNCRETLIQFVNSVADAMAPAEEVAPKRSDVVGWSELIASRIAGGGRSDYIRGHLKAIAKSAWQLSNWLTHATHATRADAELVLDATHNVLKAFGIAV